jgi:hypothetical protein
LQDTCIQMYTMQPTGIAPDFVRFPTGASQCAMFNGANTNLQRPEALEVKNGIFFQFSLCLSRACLGKIIVFIYKWLKKWHFSQSMMIMWRVTKEKKYRDAAWSVPFLSAFPMFVPSLSW